MIPKFMKPVLLMSLLFIVLGCATMEPYEYESDRDQKSGPGLFSGEKGAFTIYESPQPKPKSGKTPEVPDKDRDNTEKKSGG